MPLYRLCASLVLLYQPLILTPSRTVAAVATRIVVTSAGAAMRFLYARLGLTGLVCGGAGADLFLYGPLGAPSAFFGRPLERLPGTGMPDSARATSRSLSSSLSLSLSLSRSPSPSAEGVGYVTGNCGGLAAPI